MFHSLSNYQHTKRIYALQHVSSEITSTMHITNSCWVPPLTIVETGKNLFSHQALENSPQRAKQDFDKSNQPYEFCMNIIAEEDNKK